MNFTNEILNTSPLKPSLFRSYGGYYIGSDGEVPEKYVCEYTISGLRDIFYPLMNIKSGNNNEILVDNEVLEGTSAFINNLEDHDYHILRIMIKIIEKYQEKVPEKLYKWYLENKF